MTDVGGGGERKARSTGAKYVVVRRKEVRGEGGDLAW